jgi:hypothetical protein
MEEALNTISPAAAGVRMTQKKRLFVRSRRSNK